MSCKRHQFSVCVSSIGRNLKEWLQEQFCDKPLEQDDMRLHNAAYVGDLDTLRNLLQEDDFKRWVGGNITPTAFSLKFSNVGGERTPRETFQPLCCCVCNFYRMFQTKEVSFKVTLTYDCISHGIIVPLEQPSLIFFLL